MIMIAATTTPQPSLVFKGKVRCKYAPDRSAG